MAKRKKQRKQSLAKNIALLFLSLGILAGASILFSAVNGRSDFSYDPFRSKWTNILSQHHEKGVSKKSKVAAQESSANAYDYKYWDILLLQDKEEPPGDNTYSIQIAAFRTLTQAQKYAGDLKEKTHLQCRVVKQGNWSVVRWGNFSARSSADRYRRTLSERLNRECIVVNQ